MGCKSTTRPVLKGNMPVFIVTQKEYDNATPEEREHWRVDESILPLPDRYCPRKIERLH